MDNRILDVKSGVTAAISGLTVTGGRTIEVSVLNAGGAGINNDGTLTLTDVTVSDCVTKGSIVNGSLNAAGWGGGIRSRISSLTLNNCTIANNQAEYGGDVYGVCTINKLAHYGQCGLPQLRERWWTVSTRPFKYQQFDDLGQYG